MKAKKFLMSGIIICMSMQFLCSCGKEQTTVSNKVHVGVAYYNQSDTFLSELIACLKDQLKSLEDDNLETAMTIRDAAGSQRPRMIR